MTLISANTQAAANTAYGVSGDGTTAITLTLPPTASLSAGDTVSLTGISANPWVIAQNAGQSILTSNLNGNTAPGANWVAPAALTAQPWHWVATNQTGQVIVAGEGVQTAGVSAIRVSSDGGQTWNSFSNGVTNNSWISADVSASGDRIVAVEYGGGMWMSTDQGATWTAVADPLVASPQNFESVTISQDGQRIAAVIQNGSLVYSNDAGATWTAAAVPAPAARPWRSIDSSADGMVIVAAAQDGSVVRSTDAGATWSAVTVAAGAPPVTVFENWYRVKTSADGQTIAIAANTFGGGPGTGIYVSHDGGATWTKGFTATLDYTAIAMSADGQTIAATASTTGADAGRVLLSTDGGATFNPVTMPGSDNNWRTIAMSADGDKMVAAAGLFAGPSGLLYTSLGNRSSVGTGGSIGGGQNDSVTLQYVGNGQFSVQTSAGGPFTIR